VLHQVGVSFDLVNNTSVKSIIKIWNTLKECNQQSTKIYIILEDRRERRNIVGYARTNVIGFRTSFVITSVSSSIR